MGIKVASKSSSSSKNQECKPDFPIRFGKNYDEFDFILASLGSKDSESFSLEDILDYVKYQRDGDNKVLLLLLLLLL